MLVLARKIDEAIVITLPDKRRVRIVVVSIHEDRVRLGIEADRDIPCHREEIQFEIDRERAARGR